MDAMERQYCGTRAFGAHMRRLSPILIAAAALAVGAAPASAGGLSFSTPQQLPHGDPAQHPVYGGGEPSLAFDPSGDGHVYVTAPQGIPTAAGNALGAGDAASGVAVWASSDHGATFPTTTITGAGNGGGDSDVEVMGDHSLLVTDLEAAAAAICTSTDFGKTFKDCDGGMAKNQQGPENDRQWLTRGTKPGEVYLTYHDFAGGFPIIERSTDGGQTFAPCGTIIDPAGPAAKTYTPAGGTLVSKPIVAPDGTVYVEFTTPDATAPPVGASLNHLYMAVAKGGCTGQTVFTDHVIYEDPGASLASIFQQTARDAGGTLYVFAAGKTAAGQTATRGWLFTSSDEGQTWSKPIAVPMPGQKAAVFPTIAGGQAAGEAVLGWFGTATSGDPNDTTNQWRYYAATTYDGGRTFASTTVTPDVIHYGDICTQGIFCGLIPGQPGNRNLADFASAAIDPTSGCAALAIPGDPYNRPDLPNGDNTFGSSAYVARQAPGTCLTADNAGKAADVAAPGTVTPAAPGHGTGQGGSSSHTSAPRHQSAAERAVRRTVRRYLAALGGNHASAACAQLTPGSREKLAEVGRDALHIRHATCARTVARVLRSPGGRQLRRLAKAPIRQVKFGKAGARVSVTGIAGTLRVVRQGKAWRIVGRPAVERD
jgi:hypothetical protein